MLINHDGSNDVEDRHEGQSAGDGDVDVDVDGFRDGDGDGAKIALNDCVVGIILINMDNHRLPWDFQY